MRRQASRLAELAASSPDRVAFTVHGGQRLTFGTWSERALIRAASLDAAGVRPGVVVGLAFRPDEWLEWVCDWMAVQFIGAVTANLPPGAMRDDQFWNFLAPDWLRTSDQLTPLSVGGAHALLARKERTDDYGSDFALADVVFTSGSTGTWTPVFCEAGTLVPPAAELFQPEAAPQRTTSPERVVTFAAPGSAAAQTTLVQVLWAERYFESANAEFVILPAFTARGLDAALQAAPTRGVRLTPSQFRLLREDVPGRTYPDVQWVKVTGEPAAGSLLQGVHVAFPNARISNILGATETGRAALFHEGWSHADPPFVPTPGTDATIFPVAGQLTTNESEGELALRLQDARGHRYLDVQHNCPAVPTDTWIRTGDLMARRGQYFFLRGRLKRVLNVGGVKLPCQLIEDACRSAHGVVDAAVVAVRSELLGEAPVVVYAPMSGAGPDVERSIAAACRQKLPPYAVPLQFHEVAALPMNTSGKVDYEAVAALVEQAGGPKLSAPLAAEAATASIDSFLVATLCAILDVTPEAVESSSFGELGMDSLMALELVIRIAEEFDVDVAPADILTRLNTTAELVREVGQLNGGRSGSEEHAITAEGRR